jgi:hypothetical protein
MTHPPIARSGAVELTAAKTRALASVENARRAGFIVSEDLSVRDPLTVASKPLRLIRDVQAQHLLLTFARSRRSWQRPTRPAFPQTKR